MQYTTLGRTGLRVSVAGLGCGGFSRLGLGTGRSEDDAIGIVRQALDLGVNLIDTAAVYGTEDVVGKALRGVDRDSVVLCTKASKPADAPAFTPEAVLASLDASLKRLGVDHAVLHVERNVDPHRPAPPRRREMHGLFEMKSYVGGIEHGGGVFGDGTHDGDDIDLLRPHLANAAVANEIGALHLT